MWKFATTTNNSRPRRVARLSAASASAALALALFLPSAATAQIFNDDIARELAGGNAEKLEDLARIVENMRGRLGEIAQKQQSLDRRLREIAGQMEELAAGDDGDKVQERMRTLESSASRAEAERGALAENFAALQSQFDEVSQFIALPPEKEFYEAAFADYRRKEYAAAVAGFQKTLRYYPDGKFNASARHWMSRSFFALGEYEPAAEEARQLIALNGGGDKVPDAMLTLAEAQARLGREAESRATLESLLAAHPTALAADRAREILSNSP